MSTDPHAPTPAGPDPADATPVTDEATPVTDDATQVTDEATLVTPPATPAAVTPASEGDWLTDAPAAGAAAAPEPVVVTPPAFTPPGTPEPDGPLAQATAVAERPEVQVGLAFLGGAVLTLVLRRFGR